MNVLIVGRTRMGGSSRCIGGLSQSDWSIRLLDHVGQNWHHTAPFQIGEIWDVTFVRAKEVVLPHTEDRRVTNYRLVGAEPNLRQHLLNRIAPWRGSITEIFGRVLGFTSSNNGFVCGRLGVPPVSTWFWIPDRDLMLRADGKHYDYPCDDRLRGLVYVGEPQALQVIPAGTLVRVSLARWWRPRDADPHLEERCYLQLSGWF